MRTLEEEILSITSIESSEQEVFRHAQAIIKSIGFDQCAYAFRLPWPLSDSDLLILNNYSSPCKVRYVSVPYKKEYFSFSIYKKLDPKKQAESIPPEQSFIGIQTLQDDAKRHGLSINLIQTKNQNNQIMGMLALSKWAHPSLNTLTHIGQKQIEWLVHVLHAALTSSVKRKNFYNHESDLTKRELEVLKWTAEGKTSKEIANILCVSKHVIDFHIKNITRKLDSPNKTAGAVKATMLGIIQ